MPEHEVTTLTGWTCEQFVNLDEINELVPGELQTLLIRPSAVEALEEFAPNTILHTAGSVHLVLGGPHQIAALLGATVTGNAATA